MNLSGANLSPSVYAPTKVLIGFDLSGADLRGANLRLVEFVETNLSGAIANEDTQWPRIAPAAGRFDPVAAGVIFD